MLLSPYYGSGRKKPFESDLFTFRCCENDKSPKYLVTTMPVPVPPFSPPPSFVLSIFPFFLPFFFFTVLLTTIRVNENTLDSEIPCAEKCWCGCQLSTEELRGMRPSHKHSVFHEAPMNMLLVLHKNKKRRFFFLFFLLIKARLRNTLHGLPHGCLLIQREDVIVGHLLAVS